MYKVLKNFFLFRFQNIYLFILEITFLAPLIIFCFICRFFKKKYSFGIGPEPLINNIAFKKSLTMLNIKSRTFVTHLYYITNSFDYIIDSLKIKNFIIFPSSLKAFIFSVFKFEALIIYFNGGSLFNTFLLKYFEPFLYKISNTKIVVMPYGGDVQDLSRSSNLLFKNALNLSYPNFKNRRNLISWNIDRWTKSANFVVSGCEWIDYMHGWDMILPAHFTVEIPEIKKEPNYYKPFTKLRIFHASNHREIKGTNFIIKTIEKLKVNFDLDIELIIKEEVSNSEIIKSIQECDLVIDQLLIGWYGLFALEAMSYCKPVISFLRKDLIKFYTYNEIINKEDFCIEDNKNKIMESDKHNFPPIINSDFSNLDKVITDIWNGKINLEYYSLYGYQYCDKYHSLKAMSKKFEYISECIGLN